jgi:hypothetical protein
MSGLVPLVGPVTSSMRRICLIVPESYADVPAHYIPRAFVGSFLGSCPGFKPPYSYFGACPYLYRNLWGLTAQVRTFWTTT